MDYEMVKYITIWWLSVLITSLRCRYCSCPGELSSFLKVMWGGKGQGLLRCLLNLYLMIYCSYQLSCNCENAIGLGGALLCRNLFLVSQTALRRCLVI